MKQIAPLALAAMLAAAPVVAQDTPDADPETDFSEGFSLLEEGTRRLLRGLMSEMEPALRDLQDALRNLDAYHPPEVLPNGDIIIRRREPLPPGDLPGPAPEGEVEL